MSYKSELVSNNVDLKTIFDTLTTMGFDSDGSSTFIPTDSGGITYKSRLIDNNIDLQKILELVHSLPDAPKMEDILIDFEYTKNDNGTYTLTAWKQTLNGEPSTEMVIPDNPKIIL